MSTMLVSGVFLISDTIAPFAEEHPEVVFQFIADHKMPDVYLDREQVRRIVINLIDNAIIFTPALGKVRVYASQVKGVQRISVEDSGVGISTTDQARLFEKFYRVQKNETNGGLGSGLGLAIVKSVVEQHGGRVYVESRLGVGSTFTIELPLNAS